MKRLYRLFFITSFFFLNIVILFSTRSPFCIQCSKAYANEIAYLRWQNLSPLSTINPASIPLHVYPGRRNILVINSHATIANQALSLKELFGDWEGTFSPRSEHISLLNSEMELSFFRSNWKFSYIRRIELFLWANKGLTEFVWHTKNKISLPINHNFHLSLKGEGFEAQGMGVSKGWLLPLFGGKNIGFGISFNFLKGMRLQKVWMEGEANTTGANDYNYEGRLEYSYTHNYLYKRSGNETDAEGNGFSFDLGLGADITPRLSVSILIHDLWGKIWWQHMPFTNANFDSHNKQYDENGYLIYNPSINGQESSANLTQTLISKTNCALHYTTDRWMLLVSSDMIKRDFFPSLSLLYHVAGSTLLLTGYDFFYNQVRIGILNKNFNLIVSCDNPDIERAKALSLNLGIYFSF